MENQPILDIILDEISFLLTDKAIKADSYLTRELINIGFKHKLPENISIRLNKILNLIQAKLPVFPNKNK